jgi:hypothetical protein
MVWPWVPRREVAAGPDVARRPRVRGFGDDTVDAADIAGVDAHRIVGDVDSFFFEPIAFDDEEQVPGGKRVTSSHDAGQQVVQLRVPDLAHAHVQEDRAPGCLAPKTGR